MINFVDLYKRIVETTGLNVVTVGSLQTAIANCMADLTSRGYKEFKEYHLADFGEANYSDTGMLILPLPTNIRKSLHCRTFFSNGSILATRCNIADGRIACTYTDGQFRSLLSSGEVIYYIKEDNFYIEWDAASLGDIIEISFCFYARLVAPVVDINETNTEKLKDINIDIRSEFEDALVFYAAYFYHARANKEIEKIQLYQSTYKYYVEDILHELSYEDSFSEGDLVVKTEDDF